MSNKKHIDRVFQEKLKDFEVSPNPKVWQDIKGKLEKSDDNQKVFPIWLRLAGVAALLLILFTIGNAIVSDSDDSNKKVVDTENTMNTPDTEIDNLDNKNVSQEDAIINTNASDLNSESNNEVTNNSGDSESNLSEINSKSNNINGVAESSSYKNTEASDDNANKYGTATDTSKSNTNAVTQKNNADDNSRTSNAVTQNKTQLNKNSNNNVLSSNQTKTEGVAQSNLEKEKKTSKAITELDKVKADEVLKDNNNNALAENQSNADEQEENLEEENKTTDEDTDEDSPSIEEEIAITEEIIEKEEEKVNRWQVYANIAPVYYNTLGKGSHIDEQFVQNSKSGEINASYGVNVSYALNEKLKVRSGINSLNLSYDTDNVILYENVGSNLNAAPRNLDLNEAGQSLSALSNSNLGAQQLNDFFGQNANAAISQRIAYYEVPLELEYNLVDNKFGVNVIGGFSTFILNDNKVYSEFDGFKTEVGQANNINNVSFSGNLGLGLDYKFSDKIKFNVQPTFKYQLNAYKNTSGNFRPYIVGVYTGLSYKF